jgi:hypothetical protein
VGVSDQTRGKSSRVFGSSVSRRLRRSPVSSVGSADIRLPLPEEGTPRPTEEQADEYADRRREVIDQGNRPLILEVNEEKPAEPFRDEHDRCSDAEGPSPASAEEQPAADRDLQRDGGNDPPERVIEVLLQTNTERTSVFQPSRRVATRYTYQGTRRSTFGG